MYELLIIEFLNLNYSLNSDLENFSQDIKLINKLENEFDDDLENKLKDNSENKLTDKNISEKKHDKSDQLIYY